MEPSRQLLVTYGCKRLLRDVLVETLSRHGWHVADPSEPSADSDHTNLVLVCTSSRPEETFKTVTSAHAEHPLAKIILLGSGLTDEEVLQLIRSGAAAYVDTSQSFDELLETLKLVSENRSPPRRRLTSLVLEDIDRLTHSHGLDAIHKLTLRETQVLGLLVKGSSNKEIASALSITLNTVKNHVHNLLDKLKAKSRHEAAWMTTNSHIGYKQAS